MEGGSLIRLLQGHYMLLTCKYFSLGGVSSVFLMYNASIFFVCSGGRGMSSSVLTYSMPMQLRITTSSQQLFSTHLVPFRRTNH